MKQRTSPGFQGAYRWVYGIFVIFAMLGAGFGSWLSRLPAVRDYLHATTLEMSVYGLVLALGSLIGLSVSGRTVAWFGPRRALLFGFCGQAVALPLASVLFWAQLPVLASVCLAVYGFSFSSADVAANVSGAAAERAFGRPRMPLLHAGYSLGSVAALGLGALAEAVKVPVPLHLSVLFAVALGGVLIALRFVPRTDSTPPVTSEVSLNTGPIEVVAAEISSRPPAKRRRYSPWRDRRIVLIGVMTMSVALAEGTASDWLPLALVDGRGLENAAAAALLSSYFVSMTLTRLAGSWLLGRFGRVLTLRVSTVLLVTGVLGIILVPHSSVILIAAVFWGMGAALTFPIGVSAAADDPRTALQGVATVSAIAYTAYLLGPMLIGFLGEHFGLLRAFWPLVAFAVFVFVVAPIAHEPRREADESGKLPR